MQYPDQQQPEPSLPRHGITKSNHHENLVYQTAYGTDLTARTSDFVMDNGSFDGLHSPAPRASPPLWPTPPSALRHRPFRSHAYGAARPLKLGV